MRMARFLPVNFIGEAPRDWVNYRGWSAAAWVVAMIMHQKQSNDKMLNSMFPQKRSGRRFDRYQQIVAAAHVSMEPAYADAPLPCETGPQTFTLRDPLPMP